MTLAAEVRAIEPYGHDSLVPNTGPNLIEPWRVLAIIEQHPILDLESPEAAERLEYALIQTGMYLDAYDGGLDSPKVYAAAILATLRGAE